MPRHGFISWQRGNGPPSGWERRPGPDQTSPTAPVSVVSKPDRNVCASASWRLLITVSYPRSNRPNLLGRLVTNPRTDDR